MLYAFLDVFGLPVGFANGPGHQNDMARACSACQPTLRQA